MSVKVSCVFLYIVLFVLFCVSPSLCVPSSPHAPPPIVGWLPPDSPVSTPGHRGALDQIPPYPHITIDLKINDDERVFTLEYKASPSTQQDENGAEFRKNDLMIASQPISGVPVNPSDRITVTHALLPDQPVTIQINAVGELVHAHIPPTATNEDESLASIPFLLIESPSHVESGSPYTLLLGQFWQERRFTHNPMDNQTPAGDELQPNQHIKTEL